MKRTTIAALGVATAAGAALGARTWMQREAAVSLPAPMPANLVPLVVPGFVVHERVTGQADPMRPLPLVLVLHGIGADERQLLPHTDTGVPARLVYIRGPVRSSDAESALYSYFAPRFAGDRAKFLAAAEDMAAKLLQALGTIASQRAVSRTLVLGYSQGGHLAWLLAASGRFDVAMPVAGALPTGYQPPPSTGRTILRGVHGEQDRTLPALAGAATFLAFQAAGYKGSLARVKGTHALTTLGHHIKSTLTEALAPTPAPTPNPTLQAAIAAVRARLRR